MHKDKKTEKQHCGRNETEFTIFLYLQFTIFTIYTALHGGKAGRNV